MAKHEEKPNRKKKTKIVRYETVPTHVSHIYTPPGQTRCPKCWLLNAKPGHFCRWNIKNDFGRNPNPAPYKKPIFGRK